MFTATSGLPGGWSVTTFEPGVRLTLARRGSHEARDAGKRLFVVLAAAAMAAALGGGAAKQGAFLMVAPVVALLGVVVVFGLLALLRSARRAAAGTHLAVDVAAGVISGFSARGTLARLRIEPLTTVTKLALEVRRGAGTDLKDPRSWATLEVVLADGSRLEAPEAWGADTQFEQTEALLLPLGRELARLCGRPLEVTKLWTGETRVDYSMPP